MKPFRKIATIIFGITVFIHLYRLITHFSVSIGSHEVPVWVNIIGFIIATTLSIGLWKESKIDKTINNNPE
jgi:hypothetical protein